jgi:DNA helicase-2/ATP-dependent DNA helicase PcrA
VLQTSGLRGALQADGTPESQDRLDNLQQLLAAMGEHAESADDPGLRSFLENVALVADTDKLGDAVAKVSMMTMHAAKGLEFDVSFVVGLEEGLLPHANVIGESSSRSGDGREVEEERRLFYVGMTRARKKLHLSYARQRRRFDGRDAPSEPSRFVEQVPAELIVLEDDGGGAYRSGAGSYGGGSWGGHANASWGQKGGSGYGQAGQGAWGSRPFAAGQTGARQGAWAAPGQRSVAAEGSEDEVVFDRSEGAEGKFRVGGKARHVRFGLGTVLDIAGYGDQAQLTIQFPQVGVKKIVARFLQQV